MSMPSDPTATIKTWLFPILMSGFAGLIWQDITEIKNDVKALMAQSNIDKTRIDALERTLYVKTGIPHTHTAVFNMSKPLSNPNPYPIDHLYVNEVAIMPDNKQVEIETEKKS